MQKIRDLYLLVRALPKTLLFNIRYFPLRVALGLPVIVSHRVRLVQLGGRVEIDRPRFGGVRIGFGNVGVFDAARSRTLWQVAGQVKFSGRASIGHGSKIGVSAGGRLEVGENLQITAESKIIAEKSISIGDDVLISWEVQIMDSDFHHVLDAAGNVVNPPKDVIIRDRVWIGCRVLVLKGVDIPAGSIIAAGTVLGKSPLVENAITAGCAARIVKEGVSWAH